MAISILECKSGHYHITDKGSKPVWPFWSYMEVREQISFLSKEGIISKSEVRTLQKQIGKLIAKRKRGKDGRFISRKLPIFNQDEIDTVLLAKSWVKFIKGKSKAVEIVAQTPGGEPVGPVVRKLVCDFIKK